MTKANETDTSKLADAARDAVKDSGRVRFGSGMIRFSDAPVSGDTIKDTGRVRLGSGMIRF